MGDASEERPAKRQRETPKLSVDDVLYYARQIFSRDPWHRPRQQRERFHTREEDQDMQEFFGCGAIHVVQMWNILVT